METLHLIDFLGRGALAFIILYAIYAAIIFLWEKVKTMFGGTVSEDVKKIINSLEASVSATFYGLDARLKEVEKKTASAPVSLKPEQIFNPNVTLVPVPQPAPIAATVSPVVPIATNVAPTGPTTA